MKPQNPFLALRSYTAKSADRFFGRDADLTLVRSRIFSAKTTLLFAGSGVGKTSFLDALLVPKLTPEWRVFTHRSWTGMPPLEALKGTLFQSSDSRPLSQSLGELCAGTADKPASVLVVLDQFEEIFQNWRDHKELFAFASALAEMIQTPVAHTDIRLLISLREEFLGDLSIFDNLIPDLFSNSYRLKNLTREQAELVIERNVEWSKAAFGPGGELLLTDLQGLRTSSGGVVVIPADQVSASNRVRPPMLQIVCDRLWETTMKDGSKTFLETYPPGAALGELETYCTQKLNSVLNESEKGLASRAFAYLMTKRGAKMPYDLDQLAEHMRAPREKLRATLDKLSADEVRILRRTPGGDQQSVWYELYHDMYAPFLFGWKQKYDEASAGAQRRRPYVAVAGVALLMICFMGYWGWREVTGFLDNPFPESGGNYANASSWLPWVGWLPGGIEQRWIRTWADRARLEAAAGRRGDAILTMLEALRRGESQDPNDYKLLAAWAGGSYAGLMRTFVTEPGESIRTLMVTSDGQKMLAAFESGLIITWDWKTGAELNRKRLPPWDRLEGVSGRPPGVTSGGYRLNRSSGGPVEVLPLTMPTEFSPDGSYLMVQRQAGEYGLVQLDKVDRADSLQPWLTNLHQGPTFRTYSAPTEECSCMATIVLSSCCRLRLVSNPREWGMRLPLARSHSLCMTTCSLLRISRA